MNMWKVVIALLLVVVTAGGGWALASNGMGGVVPKGGFVPDATTAEAIAEAVLVPIYGKEVITSERPFKATLKGEIWIVKGSVPCIAAPPGASCPGGAAEVHVSKRSGLISFMTHSQ